MDEKRSASVIEADVLVAGGGTAGAVAAIAAGRRGCRTVLIEESDMIGGTLTGQVLQHISSFHDGVGNQIIAGIPQQIVDRLAKLGGTPGHMPDTTGYSWSVTPVDHELLQFVLEQMLRDAGVHVMLNTRFERALVEDGVLRGCEALTSRSGPVTIRAAAAVDATGDAAVAAAAGAQCVGGGGQEQAMSILFTMAGVDVDAVLDYIQQHPEDFRSTSVTGPELRGLPVVTIWGFGALLGAGARAGEAPILRGAMHVSLWTQRRMAVVNVTRTAGDPLSDESRSEAILQLRQQALAFSRFLQKRVPGFAGAYLSKTGRGAFAHRAARKIVGDYTLTGEDLRGGRRFDDAVAQSFFPSDRHDARGPSMLVVDSGGVLDIPYRCMLPRGVEGLLAAGRCVSADTVASGSIRVTAPCMAMGQAAGTAAALCAQSGVSPRALDVQLLRQELVRDGVLLYTP